MINTPKRVLLLLAVVLIAATYSFAQDIVENDDQDTSQDGARVARISSLVGESTVKRIDSEEWEKVVKDLPVVEGDVYVTDDDTKLEIQLDRFNFVRLDENSELKLVFLGEDGIALSLAKGTMGVSLRKFDFDTNYLEIDAPSSTVTLQKDGTYRIDAGDVDAQAVSVFVEDGGQARIYSNDAGFTLRDGQSSRLFLDGQLKGQWDRSNVKSSRDGFDIWMSEREDVVASWLDDRDKRDTQYYDDDIYGADDLDDNGTWRYTSDYGYLWRPNRNATSRYASWSPYRYGEWRWVPYYGWTWVNDEPWGWATYHSGRWIHYRGAWYWSPYRRYRNSRNWWRPALVAFSYIGNRVCWYPLGYGSRYYDYNRRYRNRWKRKNRRNRNDRGDRRTATRTPNRPIVPQIERGGRNGTPPLTRVPAGGVVTTDRGSFGKGRRDFQRPPLTVARQVLRKNPREVETAPILPDIRTVKRKPGGVFVKKPIARTAPTRTGVITRTSSKPLDEKLRQEKIRNNRRTVRRTSTRTPGIINRDQTPVKRETKRTTTTRSRTTNNQTRPSTTRRTTTTKRKTTTTNRTRTTTTRRTVTRTPPVRRSKPPTRRSSPPVRRSKPPTRRSSPPARRSKPKTTRRSSPPVRRSKPKRSAPKRSAPKKKAQIRPKTKSKKKN